MILSNFRTATPENIAFARQAQIECFNLMFLPRNANRPRFNTYGLEITEESFRDGPIKVGEKGRFDFYNFLPPTGNIVGFGFGLKFVNGKCVTSNAAVRVYVRAKLPRYALSDEELIPEVLPSGVPVDVIEVDSFHSNAGSPTEASADEPVNAPADVPVAVPANRGDVLCGDSVGFEGGGVGTIGCLLQPEDAADPWYILSCNHVLVSDQANPVPNILQPGGVGSVVAKLAGFSELSFPANPDGSLNQAYRPNKMDAAIAQLDSRDNFSPEIRHIGRLQLPVRPSLMDTVIKSGSSYPIGVTIGFIAGYYEHIPSRVRGRETWFTEQILVNGFGGDFNVNGDSGSLVMDLERRPIGMLHARQCGLTLVSPISAILEEFRAEIVR